MDPSSWYYNRLQAQPATSAAAAAAGLTAAASTANPDMFQHGAYGTPGTQHPFILQQLR